MKKLYLLPALAAVLLLTACERDREDAVIDDTGTTNGMQPGEVSPPPESPGAQQREDTMREDTTMRDQQELDTGAQEGAGTQQGVQQPQNDLNQQDTTSPTPNE